jgi:hypothetical protein
MMTPAWTGNWAWGLPLIALTLIFHAACMVGIALAATRIVHRVEARSPRLFNSVLFSATLIGMVGCALATLHGLEAVIWAAAYLWLGALDSVSDAVLYSLDSISTRGESGLVLQRHWRLMGALEATDGVLLFGLSTAFLFVILQRAWEILNKAGLRPVSPADVEDSSA